MRKDDSFSTIKETVSDKINIIKNGYSLMVSVGLGMKIPGSNPGDFNYFRCVVKISVNYNKT